MPPLKAQLLLAESLAAYFPEMVFTDSGITVQIHRNTHLDPELDPMARDDEINLLYVASTRAMRILALNSAVEMVIRYITQKRMVEKQMKMAAEATEVEEDTTK
ncbi:hypothetical protein ACSGGA_24215 [Salmonella enterica]|uniref:hypothetical protein n=1 Tax=Salmonella enterica TaxID=28901 RepID=UPI003768CB32